MSPLQPADLAAHPRHIRDRIGFRWESDMLLPLRDALSVVVGQAPCLALLEVPAAAGVPDLVALVLDEHVIARRLAGGLAPVQDLTHARVLHALTAGIDDIDQLSTAAQVTASHLRRSVLPALTAAGWLSTADAASVVLHHTLEPIASLVVTVEAKKAAWQRAFKQALAHSASADRAFIAIDAVRATAVVEQRAALRRMGVGVLTVDAVTSRVKVVARPRRTVPVPAQRTLLAERAWALHLAGETAGPSWPVFGRTLH